MNTNSIAISSPISTTLIECSRVSLKMVRIHLTTETAIILLSDQFVVSTREIIWIFKPMNC